ncbi:cbxX/cfqX, partial [Streptococcus gordonii]|nr:cbxX/cfqX [Streptococcus gordonii]
ENAQRISFGAFSDGVVMADQMIFHKIADPNIRLQSSAYVKSDAVTYTQGDARDLITEIEDGCDYLVGRVVAKANPQTPSSGSASDTTVPATTATASEQETKRDALEELN